MNPEINHYPYINWLKGRSEGNHDFYRELSGRFPADLRNHLWDLYKKLFGGDKETKMG